MHEEIYAKFKPASLSEIFSRAASTNTTVGPFRLFLSGGHSVAGLILKIQSDTLGGWNLLIRPVDSVGRSLEGLIYIPSISVIGLAVESIETAVRDLSFGAVDKSDLVPPKSSLELKRYVSEVLVKLKSLFENQVDVLSTVEINQAEGGDRLRHIEGFFELFQTTFQELLKDDLSRKSILEGMKFLEFCEVNYIASIRLNGQRLVIQCKFTERNGGFDRHQFKSQIEKVF